jgi:prophage tail gpP-like protein
VASPVGERDPATGEWVREPSEKASELLLKIAERKARLCGLDRQQGSLVATVTAEQIAAYLGWDPQEQVQDVEAEEIDGDPSGLAGGDSLDARQ